MNLPAEIKMLRLLGSRPEHQRTISCLARLFGEPIVTTRQTLEQLAGRGAAERYGKRFWRIPHMNPMNPEYVQVTIREFYGKDRARVIHTNMEKIPPGLTRDKAVRMILSKAAEKFPDQPPGAGRHGG